MNTNTMAQLRIRVGETTSLDDISHWPNPVGNEIHFLFTRSSGFEAGAEGFAHSYLASAVQAGTPVNISCEFAQPQSTTDFFSTALSSTFGFTLIRIATNIKFAETTYGLGQDFRTFAGKIYDTHKGVIGLGDRVDIIAFDPKRRVPKALLIRPDALDKDGLPLPSAFQTDLLKILAGMGLPEIGSQSTLPTLISFIYELFLNTLQHGVPTNDSRLRHSTRGIALSKIAFSTPQLAHRKLSTELREYLLRVAEMQKRETNLMVVCISVMDMGDGIQNTLPKISENESIESRLARSFQVGASRKVSGTIERGLGLHKVVEAAFRLDAKLRVTSAGKILTKDFSFGEDRLPRMDDAKEESLPEHFTAGTCIDMYIPSLLSNIDQRKLLV